MSPTADMNEQRTNAFLIDVKAKDGAKCEYTGNQPQSLGYVPKDAKDSRESNINIFCSGHCLLPDGNLFVVGGHVKDVEGLQQACVYDWQKNIWSAKPIPRVGRWYPSALALPDSSVLTISGFTAEHHLDQVPQIWREKGWDVKLVQSPPNALDDDNAMSSILPMYPRLHLDPFGQVFMAGPNKQSLFLDLNTATSNLTGQWGPIKKELKREEFIREFGAAVTYDVGKVLWTGGGNGRDVIKVTEGGGKQAFGAPTNSTEIIDLMVKEPTWKTSPSMNMKYSRRQHNLTTLPDGTVLVTGGTRGQGFNDLTAGMPVHQAELWNPAEEKWTEMAAESTDRCYHGVALLLPDGSVFSAGGGEGGEFDAPPNPPVPNPARDNHTNAQIYKPPYFFIADAPRVTGVPKEAKYGHSFDVTVAGNDKIKRISWIRLPSVTHTLNSSQSVYFQVFEEKQEKGGKFTVVPPDNRNVATPGHYMLFFVNVQGRPSEAEIIKISPEKTAEERTLHKTLDAIPSSNTRLASRMATQTVQNLPEVNQEVIAKMDKPAVKVGLTPVCPYGLGPCWAGAFEGLQHIQDVDVVQPMPDQANSVAFVYLKEEKLPDLDVWRKEFSQVAGGAYGKSSSHSSDQTMPPRHVHDSSLCVRIPNLLCG